MKQIDHNNEEYNKAKDQIKLVKQNIITNQNSN